MESQPCTGPVQVHCVGLGVLQNAIKYACNSGRVSWVGTWWDTWGGLRRPHPNRENSEKTDCFSPPRSSPGRPDAWSAPAGYAIFFLIHKQQTNKQILLHAFVHTCPSAAATSLLAHLPDCSGKQLAWQGSPVLIARLQSGNVADITYHQDRLIDSAGEKAAVLVHIGTT